MFARRRVIGGVADGPIRSDREHLLDGRSRLVPKLHTVGQVVARTGRGLERYCAGVILVAAAYGGKTEQRGVQLYHSDHLKRRSCKNVPRRMRSYIIVFRRGKGFNSRRDDSSPR